MGALGIANLLPTLRRNEVAFVFRYAFQVKRTGNKQQPQTREAK
jgi:hypothetical protein